MTEKLEAGKYLEKPPKIDTPDFRYPDFVWPTQIWDRTIIDKDPEYKPEAVFIDQLDLPNPLPEAALYLFGFKVLESKIVFDKPEDFYYEGSWIEVYCIKEYRRDKRAWREMFFQQYDNDCDGVFYRQYGSQICESWEYEDLKNKSQYNLSGKKIYWGQHPTKVWPKGPDGLLYLVAQIKGKKRKFAVDIFPGDIRLLLFSGEIEGKLDYAIYSVN